MSETTNQAVIGKAIERLLRFAEQEGWLAPLDTVAARNSLLDLLQIAEPYQVTDAAELADVSSAQVVDLLTPLLDHGYAIGLIPDDTITYRDLLDARIMGLLLPRPSETVDRFNHTAAEAGLEQATSEFYRMNIASNYIRMDRIDKNEYWVHEGKFGKLEITINLSKPEKDPKEIALLKSLPQAHYPKNLLSVQNVGYAGRPDHPARQNLRVLPVTLQGEQWYFQYSPYVYYNEHCIVFKGAHDPMVMSPVTFARLLEFVEQYPHYFIGSNADLPIVGGSILSQDHFQGGRHVFAMEEAPIVGHYAADGQELSIGTVQWPLSVVRLRGKKDEVLSTATMLFEAWKQYSDPAADIFAFTEQADGSKTPHNTITPIARLRGGELELDLVLRNNRTSEEHPDGIFHPHQELHHIKKENIGLIEVMGLAVLPGRLQTELGQIADYLSGAAAYKADVLEDGSHVLHKHAAWISELVAKYGTANSQEEAQRLVRLETGEKFVAVLEDAGVYKQTEAGQQAFGRFLTSVGLMQKA